MTTPKKSAKEISDAIITQLQDAFNQNIPLYAKAFTRVLAKICGGLFVTLYAFASFILLQMFIKTASNRELTIGGIKITPLQEWGKLVNVFQLDGVRSEFYAEVTVLQTGLTLPAGTEFIHNPTQQVYRSTADVLLSSSSVMVQIRANQAAAAGDLVDGETISFINAPSYVKKDCIRKELLVAGADPETTEEFRQRIAEAFAFVPQGGAYSDYRIWGKKASADVKQIYPYSGGVLPNSGSGQVDVFVESKTDVDGIPTQALLDTVKAGIDLNVAGIATQRPINAYTNVAAITRTAFEVVISGLTAPDEDETKLSIEDGLTTWFLDRDPYINGLSLPPKRDAITDAVVSGVVGRIAEANGGTITGAIVKVGGAAIDGVYLLSEGEKSKLDFVTWA